MKKNYSIKIPLKKNSYEVMVGTNIINKCKNKIFSTIKDAKKIFVVTDTKIKKLHWPYPKNCNPAYVCCYFF